MSRLYLEHHLASLLLAWSKTAFRAHRAMLDLLENGPWSLRLPRAAYKVHVAIGKLGGLIAPSSRPERIQPEGLRPELAWIDPKD